MPNKTLLSDVRYLCSIKKHNVLESAVDTYTCTNSLIVIAEGIKSSVLLL